MDNVAFVCESDSSGGSMKSRVCLLCKTIDHLSRDHWNVNRKISALSAFLRAWRHKSNKFAKGSGGLPEGPCLGEHTASQGDGT